MAKELRFRTDDRTIRRLCDVQNIAGAEDFGDLFRRALALFELAARHVDKGKIVCIVDPVTGKSDEITNVVKGIDPDHRSG
jgi:hypothetical protein